MHACALTICLVILEQRPQFKELQRSSWLTAVTPKFSNHSRRPLKQNTPNPRYKATLSRRLKRIACTIPRVIAFCWAWNHHGAMSDIFISYARADKDKAELLANAFSRKSWSVWWDREIPPGKSFDETIEHALSSARCVVVLWSKTSVSSRWVKTEAAEGAERGILVPALIDHVKIPLEFKRIEAADLSDWQGDSSHREFDHLVRTVAGMLDGSAPVQPRPMPTETEVRSRYGSKAMWGVLAGVVAGVIGALAVLHQMGFFEKQHPQSQNHVQSAPPTMNIVPGSTEPGPGKEEQAASAVKPAPPTPSGSSVMNVLSAENGGHVVAATNDRWPYAIDGDEKNWQYIDIGVAGGWAVYGFKNDKPASFDTFRVLVLGTESWNLKEFELLAGNDSATGKFESIGKFQTQNVRFFKDPYQEFKFPPVKARYLKVKVISSHGFSSVGVYEFQLLGALEG
jgi:TIR domain